jgi:hypothetical protein
MEALVPLIVGLIMLGAVILLWGLPIVLGVQVAERKGYSPHWMWFGLHPVGGWVAFIVLSCLPPRIRCPACMQSVSVKYSVCPYCRASIRGTRQGPPGR